MLNDVSTYNLKSQPRPQDDDDNLTSDTLEDPPLHVDEFRAASLNGYIYAVGGFDNESDMSPYLRAVQ